MQVRRTHNHPVELRTRCSGTMTAPPESLTVGWQPACTCDAGDPVPCRVLDPFGGAGTTALVADRLGRDCTLVELNGDYCNMAEKRLRDDAPLFAEVEAGG